MTLSLLSGPPGELESPKVGLGESVFTEEIFGWRATGPFTLFSVSSNTIEVLLRLRERLQSALLQEQGTAARLLVAFYLWIPGKGAEQPGKTEEVSDSSRSL